MEFYARKWAVLYDGGSGEWRYFARSGNTYVFIRIMDMVDACGRDATYQWDAEVSSVDLDAADADTIQSALECCGQTGEHTPDLATDEGKLTLAICMFDYGAKSPLWSDGAGKPSEYASDKGKPFLRLRAAARREAERMLDDSERDHVLDTRVVNAVGQTAREFAGGRAGLHAALARIASDPDASVGNKLLLKLHGVEHAPKREHTIHFGTLQPDGALINERRIKQSDVRACPHAILMAGHYRADGSCKCSNAEERARMISEWEYTAEDFTGVPLID